MALRGKCAKRIKGTQRRCRRMPAHPGRCEPDRTKALDLDARIRKMRGA